ncbi:MAG: hypothetical protein GC182_14835 [Rhodopseudomonas sp.]|nr:hypothetical protein [Rhodopseudomonas sp.]
MPFDETAPLPPKETLRIGEVPLDGPTFLQSAGAAFRQDNIIGSVLTSEKLRTSMDEGIHEIDRNYNVFNDIKGYEDHIDRFENVFNARAASAMKAQIDQETRDRKTLAASGWLTRTALTMGATLLDPTIMLPGGAFVEGARGGYALGKTALSVGGAAAAAASVQEAGLQATQELRTPGESLANIGGAAVLGGLLGAGASRIMNGVEAGRAASVVKKAAAPDFDAATDVLHKELTEMAAPQSVGAAAVPKDALDDLSIAGAAASKVAKATAQLNPLLRTLHSPSQAVRDIASKMMDTPVYLKKNLKGAGDPAAETSMLEYTRGAVTQALEAQETAYFNARKAGNVITRKEFRDAIGQAMRRGDKSDIPGVTEAATAWRSHVIEPLKQRAVSAGLLPADVSVNTAASYFSRMWNRPAIEANEGEFRKVVRGWLEGSLSAAEKADASRVEARASKLRQEKDKLDLGIMRREEAASQRANGGVWLDEVDANAVSEVLQRTSFGERPQAPQGLAEWLRGLGKDGIHDPAGDLASAFPEAKQVPGLIRKSLRGTANPQGGVGLDEIASRAWQEGFIGDTGANIARPAARDLLEALADDLRGSRVVRATDREAARKAGDFDRLMQALSQAGADPGKPVTDVAAAVRGIAQNVSRVLLDMDRQRAAKLGSDIAETQQRGRFDFLSEADRAAYLNEIVDDIFAKVTGRGIDGSVPTDLVVTKRGPLKERTFNIPDDLVERFLDNDAEFVGRRYARIMSADIELSERFGDPTMKGPVDTIRKEYADLRQAVEANGAISATQRAEQLKNLNSREKADIRDIEAVRDMLRGNYRPEIQHTGWARTLAAVGIFNYMRALGGVLVASLSDAVRPAMVHGLTAYMSDGLGPLIRNAKALKMSRQEAKLAGAISEKVLASRLATMAEITDPHAMNSPFERFLQNAATGFTRMTGLLHWNDFHKEITSTMVQNRILKNAEAAAAKGFKSLPPSERAYMGFLGIGQERAESLGRLFGEHGETLEGVRVANTEKWGDDPAAVFLRHAYRAAINKDVDSVIVTKGHGDVPLFMSTPVGRALGQFKSFAIASNQRVLIRGLQEDTGRFVGGVVGMATIGAFIYMLKQLESGREISNNPGTWIAEGLDRSGIFSVAFEINNALEKAGAPGIYRGTAAMFPTRSQKQPASRFAIRSVPGALAGPTFGLATDTVSMIGLALANMERAAGGDGRPVTESDISTMRRLTPYASLPYWRWLIDGMVVPQIKKGVK